MADNNTKPSEELENADDDGRFGAGIDFTDPNSPLAPYYLRMADLIGIVLLAAIVWFYSLVPLWHTDIWGHLAYGDFALRNNHFADREPFTPYSDPGVELVQTQWLSQIAYAGMLRFGEWTGRSDPQRSLEGAVDLLRGFHILVLWGRFLFLWLAFRRISGSSTWANLALIVLFASMAQPSAIQRPQTIGMMCFGILLFMISRDALTRWGTFGPPILFLFWVNLHGSFVAGLGFLILFVAGRVLQHKMRDGQSWRATLADTPIRRLLLAVVLSCLAACINPHGPLHYYHVATFASRPNIRDLDEWLPMAFHSGPGGHWIFVVSWVLVALAWTASGFKNSLRFLSCVPFGLWPILQERAIIWWLLLVPWLIAGWGPAIVERIGTGAWMPASVPSLRKTMVAAAVLVLLLLWLPPTQWLLKGRPKPLDQALSNATPWRLGLELNSRPETRGAWLPEFDKAIKTYPQGRFAGTIFSSETQGDFLICVAPPRNPVLVYSHAHVFTRDHWRNCILTKLARGEWREYLDREHVNLIVIEPDLHPAFTGAIRQDDQWRIIVDEAAVPNRTRGDRLFIALRKKPI